MLNENKYNLPWKVEYGMDWGYDEKGRWMAKGLLNPLEVWGIVDCKGNSIIQTDCGYYGPNVEVAEFIVNTINESHEVKVQCGKNAMSHMAEYHRAEEFKTILKDILDADERGQGLPFKEAMTKAYNYIKEN